MTAHLPDKSRSTISRFAKPAHKIAARDLGLVLTCADPVVWPGFATVISVRLSTAERVALAFWTSVTLDDDHAQIVADARHALNRNPPDPLDRQDFRDAILEYRAARGRAA